VARLMFPRMPMSTLFRSWAMPRASTPRASSLSILRRSTSARLRSVMSMHIAKEPWKRPEPSNTGVHDTSVQTSLPSLVRKRRSDKPAWPDRRWASFSK
jgi:hypothetical protein